MVPDRREGGVWYPYPLLTQLSPQGILSPDTPVPFFFVSFLPICLSGNILAEKYSQLPEIKIRNP